MLILYWSPELYFFIKLDLTAVLLKQVFWIVIVLTSLSNFSLILPKKGPKFPLKCLRECHINLSGDETGHPVYNMAIYEYKSAWLTVLEHCNNWD